MISGEILLLLTLLIPIVGASLILLFGMQPNVRETVTLLSSTLLFTTVIVLYQRFSEGDLINLDLFEPIPGLSISLSIEAMGMLFSLIASFLWILTSIYAIGYMRSNREGSQTRFYIFFSIAIGATMGVAFSANLFTLFLFYEILSLCTWPLVTHGQTSQARRSGRIYLGILLGTSFVLFLPAIVWTWIICGHVDFLPGGIFPESLAIPVIMVLLLMFFFGVAKTAVMPLHSWLPAAMVAPTPVSALLHAVAVVKAGVFSLVKIIVYIFGEETLLASGITDWLIYIAGFTIVMASIVALYQDNLKKRLAYSTISQLSYVVIAALLIAPTSISGAVIHIAAHAFGKITLFFTAGAIYTVHHKTEVSQLDGIGRQMPWSMTAFSLASLSMIGVPLTAGFLSKWYIIDGALVMGNAFVVIVIVISTLLNAGYFLPIVYAAFFKSGTESTYNEAPLNIMMPLLLTSAICVFLFFIPDQLLQLVGKIGLSSS